MSLLVSLIQVGLLFPPHFSIFQNINSFGYELELTKVSEYYICIFVNNSGLVGP